jgi:hypothetical protein
MTFSVLRPVHLHAAGLSTMRLKNSAIARADAYPGAKQQPFNASEKHLPVGTAVPPPQERHTSSSNAVYW